MDHDYVTIGTKLLEGLQGRLHFSFTREERFELGVRLLEKFISSEEGESFRQAYSSYDRKREFLERFFSYDAIDDLIQSDDVEDIAIHGLNFIYAHTSNRGFIKTDRQFKNYKELDFFINKLLTFAGRTILKKTNDFELPYIEGRVNIVESPYGPQITITKIKKIPLSLIELIDRDNFGYRIGGFLWLMTEGCGLRPANILIVGGPGAGKTTLLNALISFIPDNERVVVIEDTLELNSELRDNVARLESTEDLTLENLVRNSLRMRPDRVIVGEVRGNEAQDMITAMNLGKYCMCTIHAATTQEAFNRLENFPMNVPPGLLNLIDIVIVANRFHRNKNVRRVINEISETAFMEQKRPLVSKLWRYSFEKDVIQEVATFTIFREKLSLATGKSLVEIIDELERRSKLVYLMHAQKRMSFKEVTEMASIFFKNDQDLLDYLRVTPQQLKEIDLDNL